MPANRPVEVFRIMGSKQTIPHHRVTIADWMRLLALEECYQPAMPERRTKVVHERVQGSTENLPNAATRLGRVYRAHLVNGTHPWITEYEVLWKLLGEADLEIFTSACTIMAAPASKDQVPLKSFRMTHLALAESELKNYQADIRNPFSQ